MLPFISMLSYHKKHKRKKKKKKKKKIYHNKHKYYNALAESDSKMQERNSHMTIQTLINCSSSS
ncbi:hypothetical protein HYC85_021371 [Camellia sinensis]|uniref:Uncharacterized protein n=1 Tax=Camellia sinensis TaxID=4442 RepID=A0A7J7GLB5_CAMSI|nr:hypothetical protein HYC85_021371 [Camellia sinensis]